MMRYVHNETVKGASHADAGKECQDASLSWRDDGLSIIAVSDGHSGERHYNSALGANLACKVALRQLREFGVLADADRLKADADGLVRRLCMSIVARWVEEVAEQETQGDADSFGCTLIAYLQTADYWLALQIGDGRCAMLRDGDWTQPVPWDDRCFLGMTTSLCDEVASREFRYACGDAATMPDAVFLCSDGVDGTFGAGELLYGFYANILKSLGEDGTEEVENKLPEVLAHYSRSVSKDDMSLAFAVS